MAYTDKLNFIIDFNATWRDAILRGKDNVYQNQPYQAALDGYYYYQAGRAVGRRGALKIGLYQHLTPLLAAQGSVFDVPPPPRFGGTRGFSGAPAGNLFVERTGQSNRWKLFFNDCFILGGVHERAQFQLVNPTMAINDDTLEQNPAAGFAQLDYITENAPSWKLKVTQREVLGLTAFGYSSDNAMGYRRDFQCVKPAEADAATLPGYKQLVDAFAANF